MKQVLFFISLSLTLLLFFACKESDNIKLASLNYADAYYLSSDTTQGALVVSIQVELPAGKMKADSVIRAFLVDVIFGGSYTGLSDADIVSAFTSDLKQDYRANNEPLLSELEDEEHSYSLNNEHFIEGFPLLNDKNIFSYGVNHYAYMGGAHGIDMRSYYSFDLKTLKPVTEQNLFADGCEAELIELLKTRIIEESEFIHSMEDLKNSDYYVDSIKPNGNFYISDEAITYVFNPYEIAPYYMGHTEISLPYSRIAHLLKLENPVAYLAGETKK
ncbi:MAG: DUF3298 and DUF4163 domain-containing protein [Prevotellaceae bacterium]|jgi:hypothetical protein|nr:DUF3298 and DUF4163 domain-containing protein [Prevotellaceae bacterium]